MSRAPRPQAQAEQLCPLTISGWSALPWLVHGFSTRAGGVSTAYRSDAYGGDLNLGFTAADAAENVRANRQRLLKALVRGAPATDVQLVTVRQTHSATLRRVTHPETGAAAEPVELEGDGLMTDCPGVLLGILTADCVPVLVVDPSNRAVAAFHAGWRGTVQQIVEAGIERMAAEFGSKPDQLLAAIGPAIGSCCYGVGEEVRQQFAERFAYADELFTPCDDGPLSALDLPSANRRQLLSAGLRPASIFLTRACTSCDTTRFFSHRAENGFTGRMMAAVGIRRIASRQL